MDTTIEIERYIPPCIDCGKYAKHLVNRLLFTTYKKEYLCENCSKGHEVIKECSHDPIELEVTYDFNEAEKRTYDYPGCDAYVDVVSILHPDHNEEIKHPAKWLMKMAKEAAERDAFDNEPDYDDRDD